MKAKPIDLYIHNVLGIGVTSLQNLLIHAKRRGGGMMKGDF